jgi:hypothetical protein
MAMTEFLSRFDYDQLMGFLVVGGGLLLGLIAIVGNFWNASRKSELAAALKQDMLNRGMSAEEIRTVLDAGTKRSRRCGGDA